MTEDPLGENQEAPFTKSQALRMRHCVVELVRPELSGFSLVEDLYWAKSMYWEEATVCRRYIQWLGTPRAFNHKYVKNACLHAAPGTHVKQPATRGRRSCFCWLCTSIETLNRCLLSAYCVPGTLLKMQELATAKDKTDQTCPSRG